jgi:4a-hydroxytetrahydrobiopterin dehydratase
MSSQTNKSIDLAVQHCQPCKAGTPALQQTQVTALLHKLDNWTQHGQLISKTFTFSNFDQAMSFVNAVAWISSQQDHHPDLAINYNKCKVEYTTHSVGGLSENDFICAAKVDALLSV